MYSLCKILSHVIHSCLCLSSLTSCHLSVAISHSLTGCQLNHAYGQSKFSHEFSRYWDWVGYSGLPPVLVSIAFVPSPSISRCFFIHSSLHLPLDLILVSSLRATYLHPSLTQLSLTHFLCEFPGLLPKCYVIMNSHFYKIRPMLQTSGMRPVEA